MFFFFKIGRAGPHHVPEKSLPLKWFIGKPVYAYVLLDLRGLDARYKIEYTEKTQHRVPHKQLFKPFVVPIWLNMPKAKKGACIRSIRK